jgi:hypothetical protein
MDGGCRPDDSVSNLVTSVLRDEVNAGISVRALTSHYLQLGEIGEYVLMARPQQIVVSPLWY